MESHFSLYILADMLNLAQLKWRTEHLKVPFLFSFGPSWFNLEYPLSEDGCWILTGNEVTCFLSKRAIYDSVHLPPRYRKTARGQSKAQGLCGTKWLHVHMEWGLAPLYQIWVWHSPNWSRLHGKERVLYLVLLPDPLVPWYGRACFRT